MTIDEKTLDESTIDELEASGLLEVLGLNKRAADWLLSLARDGLRYRATKKPSGKDTPND